MSTTVLVLNCGSSSVRYELIDPVEGTRFADGMVERIGEATSTLTHTVGGRAVTSEAHIADHHQALRAMLERFDTVGPSLGSADLAAVGHRVVMGGAHFAGPVLIDAGVIETIDSLSPLAPLHNPANLAGIEVVGDLLADLPQVAVFDTAFFRDLPEAAATYALNAEVAADHAIRRYGAHGTSHQYVSQRVTDLLGPERSRRQIVLHLGNGASASAVVDGRAVETSMGFTPLEGLVMGTRTGDLDPAVVLYLARQTDKSLDDIDELLNRQSGMLGLTGANDLRDVHRMADGGDERASLALEVYAHRVRKYLGAYAAVMGGLDAVTFTAGVGENDVDMRFRIMAGLEFLGIEVDPGRNRSGGESARTISAAGSRVAVMVVPTDEELAIAQQTLATVDAD